MNLKKELMNFLQSLDGDELRNLADGSLPEEMAVDAYLGIKAEAKQRAAHHQMLEGATVKEKKYMKACSHCAATGFIQNPDMNIISALTIPCPICNGNKAILVTETFDSPSPQPSTAEAEEIPHISESKERNWEEDYPHENGCYQNRCSMCGNLFLGMKRRPICKLCFATASADYTKMDTLAPAEKVERFEKVERMSPNFIVKVDDGFCEWEYQFALRHRCIDDVVCAIENTLNTKRKHPRMVRPVK